MKQMLLSSLMVFFTTILLAQFPSMTISHQGLAPSDTLTVFAGDSITFNYGGGGPHPMTEGWQTGQTSTPVPFPTQTVTSAIPKKTFALDTPGVYYFHCGTNPMNSDNWGKITVLESVATGVKEKEDISYNIYPNPVKSILHIQGFDEPRKIYDLTEKEIMEVNESKTSVEQLPAGIYILRINSFSSLIIKK